MSTLGTVGFIGLGQMGTGMSHNLLAAGYDVLAYDVAPQPLDLFASRGGRKAVHPAQIGAECERVIVMVVNAAQVDVVINGSQGLLQTMTRGTIMVGSTLGLADLHKIAKAAEARGIAVMDCPVSGGVQGANEGTLAIFCGGKKDVVDAQLTLLKAVGGTVSNLGPLGAGLVGKLAQKLITCVSQVAIAEAMAMAKRAEVPLAKLRLKPTSSMVTVEALGSYS